MRKLFKSILILLIVHCSLFIELNAQVGINNDNSEPDESAMLDVKSDSKGMLVPRLSSSQRTMINGPATGLLVFDTDTETFWFKDATAWVELVSGNVSALTDADGDTKIDVDEGGSDPDVVTIDLEGNESFRMTRGNINFLNSAGNIYLGDEAGKSDNFTGGSNIGIGTNALSGNSTGSNNTAIGNSADVNSSNLTNATAIGALATVDQSNALILGNNADVGIGTSAPDEKLHVVGNIKMEDGNEQTGYVLTSDANGVGTWQAINNSMTVLKDTDGDTQIQVEESADEDVIRFDVFNTEALQIESDFSSTSSINVNTIPSFTSVTTISGNQPQPDWQSFTATARGKIDSLRMYMQRGNFTGVSTYNFNIYKGEGTSGVLLTSTSASPNLTESEMRRIPVTDEVILEKDSIYTISFDDEAGLGYKPDNPYPGGKSGSIFSNEDYILEVYTFSTSPNTTINGTLNVTGSEATVTADAFIGDGSALTNLPSQVPIGTIIMWPSETPPAGWLSCNGLPFVRDDYPELFDLMGDTGDGTANVPNFRGRFPLGVGNSQTTYSTNHAIKSTGGFEKHKLSINEMPAHTHGIQYREGTEQGSGNDYSDLGDTGVTDSTQSTGGSQEHNNMPPFYTINFIIKAE